MDNKSIIQGVFRMKKRGFFSLKSVIIFAALFIIMYTLISIKPFGTARLLEITGGHNILDMEMRGYTADRAYEIFDALGEEGRAFDLSSIIPIDFPFPLSYALLYFVTLTFLTKRLFSKMKKPWLIGLIGLAAGLSDWLENVMVIIMLKNYPNRLSGIAEIGSIFTQLKSLLITASMGLIALGIILFILKTLFNRTKST